MAVVVQVAKIPTKKVLKRDLYAMVCYYYPQYKLHEAQRLPARNLLLLLRTAQRLEAMQMYNMTQIAAAPHTKNGKAVQQLLGHFKKLGKD